MGPANPDRPAPRTYGCLPGGTLLPFKRRNYLQMMGLNVGTDQALKAGDSRWEEEVMEIIRRHMAMQPTRLAAYLALQCALMRRYLAKGGTAEEFCERLAPIYHRRYAPLILADAAVASVVLPESPRLRQEWRR